MTSITHDMEELGRIEEDFEATVFDTRFTDENKFNLLTRLIENMVDVVHRAFRTKQYDHYDLGEYVQDFFQRGDLGPALAEQAFQGDNKDMLARKLTAFMAYSNVQLERYCREPESYRIPEP